MVICSEAKRPKITFMEDHRIAISEEPPDPSWEGKFQSAESKFVQLLSPEEVERYREEWLPARLPGLYAAAPEPVIETWRGLAGGYWIAKRAYAFGWTAERLHKLSPACGRQ
jgi:hypothetical protein